MTTGSVLRGDSPERLWLHERLRGVDFTYPVLDVGGGHHHAYHNILGSDHERTVALNLHHAKGIDVAADAERTFPFVDESFRTVLCLNVLEHVYDFKTTIEEMYRVLKPGGSLIISVPFIHRIHADPFDYNRFTEHRLRRDLERFESVVVRAMDAGPFSASVALSFRAIKTNVLKLLAWHFSRLGDRLLDRVTEELRGKFPVYYFVIASK